MTNTVVKAVSYSRVSTFDQSVTRGVTVKGSLEEQRAKAEATSLANNWHYVSDYCEPGVSGEKFEERTALQQLLKDAVLGKFNVVIALNGDRIARDVAIYHTVIKLLENDCKIPVYLLSNPLAIDPLNFNPKDDDSRLIAHSIEAMFGALDQAKRRRRLQEGKIRQIQAGRFISPVPPFGYRFQERMTPTGKVEKNLVVEPSEYAIIEILPRWVLEENLGDRAISRRLTEMGVPTRLGANWIASTIANILTNPFYAGKLSFAKGRRSRSNFNDSTGISANHKYPAPWTWDTFQSIQSHRIKKTQIPPRQHASRSPLAGIIKCGYCGSPMQLSANMTGNTQRKKNSTDYYHYGPRAYFLCGSHVANKLLCTHNRTPANEVVKRVWQNTLELAKSVLDSPGEYDPLLPNQRTNSNLNVLETSLAALLEKYEIELPKKEKRLKTAFLDGAVSQSDYPSLLEIIRNEQVELEGKIARLRNEVAELQGTELNLAAFVSALYKINQLTGVVKQDIAEWPEELVKEFRVLIGQIYTRIEIKSQHSRKANVGWNIELNFIVISF